MKLRDKAKRAYLDWLYAYRNNSPDAKRLREEYLELKHKCELYRPPKVRF